MHHRSKKDPAAQDKMSAFDGGWLQIERRVGTSVLRYHLTSRALLFCFLASPQPDNSKKDDSGDEKKLSPRAGYIFSGIFAFLYLVGRILEDRQSRARFEKVLLEA